MQKDCVTDQQKHTGKISVSYIMYYLQASVAVSTMFRETILGVFLKHITDITSQ
jgi:hypothetical protein